jgi:type II secretory pathway component PulJ
MTLLEVLISLALLSALAVASLGFARAARDLTRSAEPITWLAAAERVLELIKDDITTGDFSPSEEEETAAATTEKITVQDGVLRVRTRSRTSPRGAITRETFRRREDGRLVATESGLSEPAHDKSEEGPRVLLGGVSGWVCQIDEQPSADGGDVRVQRWLVVRIDSKDGLSRSARIFLGTRVRRR